MTVNLSNLPKHITLAVGEVIIIPLPSYADSGNTWSAICLHGHEIANILIELGKLPVAMTDLRGNGTAEPPPLMLTPEEAVISGLAVGETVWQLVLSRTFGSAQATAIHNLQITVNS